VKRFQPCSTSDGPWGYDRKFFRAYRYLRSVWQNQLSGYRIQSRILVEWARICRIEHYSRDRNIMAPKKHGGISILSEN
jgi:hypothetical protein